MFFPRRFKATHVAFLVFGLFILFMLLGPGEYQRDQHLAQPNVHARHLDPQLLHHDDHHDDHQDPVEQDGDGEKVHEKKEYLVEKPGEQEQEDIKEEQQEQKHPHLQEAPRQTTTTKAPEAPVAAHEVVPEVKEDIKERKEIEDEKKEKEVEDDDMEDKQEEEDKHQMQIGALPVKFDKKSPGENGQAVVIDENKLSPEEKKKYDAGFKQHAINQYASDMISVHRTLLDVRDPRCKNVSYRANKDLPDASVIIIFHNEAWSVLLRTVHSVIDRSPPDLLKQVILVDDASELEHLKTPLDDYVESLEKVEIVRARQREGLIRARLMGAAASTADVLIFLDSHCEATIGWMEPLLDRIADDWSHVLTPVIDIISDSTLSYGAHGANSVAVGGFDWGLIFNWHMPPARDKNRPGGPISPLRSPTMAGGLFAINRKYFEHLGSYDPGFDIWGGENLEISFKTWMCGGTLETIPCSHVGHIFRKRSPYSWKTDTGSPLKRNLVRLALVWLDEYKDYYLQRINHDLGNYGDISERIKLRERLNCKSFDWYIKNIFPELYIPGDSVAMGEIRNPLTNICVDGTMSHKDTNKPIGPYPCHKQGGNQYFMLSPAGEIRRDNVCLDYSARKQKILMWSCHGHRGNQQWQYREYFMLSPAGEIRRDDICLDYGNSEKVIMFGCHGQKGHQLWEYREDGSMYHPGTGRCLEVSADRKALLMQPCNTSNQHQVWSMKLNQKPQQQQQH